MQCIFKSFKNSNGTCFDICSKSVTVCLQRGVQSKRALTLDSVMWLLSASLSSANHSQCLYFPSSLFFLSVQFMLLFHTARTATLKYNTSQCTYCLNSKAWYFCKCVDFHAAKPGLYSVKDGLKIA